MNKTKPPKVPKIKPYVDGKAKGYELDYVDIRSGKRKRFRIQGRKGIAEKEVISIYNEMMAYHKKRIKFLDSWINSMKLFIIRNEHPEDLELLKLYIDDYTVVLTWKELLQKLNTDIDKIYELSKHPYLMDVDIGYDKNGTGATYT